jgi:DNA-binding Lrp family transcriptional regulator
VARVAPATNPEKTPPAYTRRYIVAVRTRSIKQPGNRGDGDMVTAFVLINLEDKLVRETAERLLELKGVREVHAVAGEYDLVAVVRVATNAELSELITEKIIHSTGVARTKTLFALQTVATVDLAKVYKLK